MNKPNVITLFGINAAGKTTIGLELARALGDVPIVQSSRLLMEHFGCDRFALEKMSPSAKKQTIHDTLLKLFERYKSLPYIIADIHLLVNIHRDNQTFRENMWSTDYVSSIRAAFFLDVSEEEIQRRRIEDQKNTGRVRDIDMGNIIQDRQYSLELFRKEPAQDLGFTRVMNANLPVAELVSEILCCVHQQNS